MELKPFIRWAGGKQSLIKRIKEYAPSPDKVNTYYEPFLGAGSLFFCTEYKHSVLSDINPDLINCYKQIKKKYEDVSKYLEEYKAKHSKVFYYEIREEYNQNQGENTIEQAARFIYLVQSSFNGIYRVNQNGEYNVPYGKDNPSIPTKEYLKKISKKLKSAIIKCSAYKKALGKVNEGDFVYLDPPYPPLSETSVFQHYTKDRFPPSKQEELATTIDKLRDNNAYILISNAETDLIKNLYSSWTVKKISVRRYVMSTGDTKTVSELLIQNY